jgi:hypothetical protein
LIKLPSSMPIYLAAGAVDLRKSIDGLGTMVSARGHDLYSGHCRPPAERYSRSDPPKSRVVKKK